jgi:hypothetical protein
MFMAALCNYLSAHNRVRGPRCVQQGGRKVLREANQILCLGQFKECSVYICDLTITCYEASDEAARKNKSFWYSLLPT